MACYAAVLSLFHTLNNIKKHPRPPISLDQQQLHSLTQNLTFFQHFLELHPTYEDDHLESRIAAAAYAAEDLIDVHIVDQIDHAGSVSDYGEIMSSVDLYGDLEVVIQEMDLIKEEVEIIQQRLMRAQHHPHMHTNSSVSTASGGPASTWQSSIAPAFDDAMITQVLDKLTGQQRSLQIIPIVGMGGIGKTTFARNIYANPLTVQHFDSLAWVTVSQEYSRKDILQVLCQEIKGSINGLSGMGEDEIGLILYKHLWGRRYLVVLDDIWSVDAWNKVKYFFPDNNNGSRIMITTRLSNLGLELSRCHVIQMKFLDEDKSWILFCEIVFGKLDCPVELEDVGKEIAKKCRGLPLSIVVIGGLLKISNMTQIYWIYTLENLNSLINLENNEYTLRILQTSYKELPTHLKPCFLYIGIFPEDCGINVLELVKLWVSEGILKPNDDKTLEESAQEYLSELINRNLILVSKLRWNGEAKECKIHDLLRDVCLREAKKQKFLCIAGQQKNHSLQGINMERRICIDSKNAIEEYFPEFLNAIESTSLTRSLLYTNYSYRSKYSASLRFRLLKVFSSFDGRNILDTESNNVIFEQANLRYISLGFGFLEVVEVPNMFSLCSLLWNLQTLKVEPLYCWPTQHVTMYEVWEMPLLRHVMLQEFVLGDPPDGEDNFVLENLQTLSRVLNLKFSEEAVRRIPNIKKLKLFYRSAGLVEEEELPDFCFNNLGHLQKLECLDLIIGFYSYRVAENVRRNLASFPHSLKKLSLDGTRVSWEELTIRIGSLPLLQFLKVGGHACVGPRWETVEGKFCSLRLLKFNSLNDLQYWETDSAHFPRLEHIFLYGFSELEEIPSSIGDIPTLKSIRLQSCSESASESARRIKEEQEENGNEVLRVLIDTDSDEEDEAVLN